MRPHEFIHRIVSHFSEMDESEARDLHSDATQDYKDRLDAAKAKEISNMERLKEVNAHTDWERDKKGVEPTVRRIETLNVQDRLVLKCESWMVRYGFAIAFIVIYPIVRGYMNGEEGGEEGEGGQELEFMKLFTAYQKMKKV